MTESLSKEMIRTYLKNKKILVLCFNKLDSTNLYIERNRDLYKSSVLVTANQQTNGRGRNNHSFFSSSTGGLYFSFTFKDYEQFTNVEYITPLTAVAICNVFKKMYNISLSIKWLNDLYYNNKKAGGILCKKIYSNNVPVIVVGIGLNLTTQNFPKELESIATSIFNINLSINKELLIATICNEIFELLQFEKLSKIHDKYIDLCQILHKNVTFTDEIGNCNIGYVQNIDIDYNLEILDSNGNTHIFSFEQIHIMHN